MAGGTPGHSDQSGVVLEAQSPFQRVTSSATLLFTDSFEAGRLHSDLGGCSGTPGLAPGGKAQLNDMVSLAVCHLTWGRGCQSWLKTCAEVIPSCGQEIMTT